MINHAGSPQSSLVGSEDDKEGVWQSGLSEQGTGGVLGEGRLNLTARTVFPCGYSNLVVAIFLTDLVVGRPAFTRTVNKSVKLCR